jgi:putative transposase
MTYPRSMSVSLASTPYYHVVGRCVRRAWLWGVDEYSGKDYSHRKVWMLDRLSQLCAVFAIDCLAYAVMNAYAKYP